MPSSIFNFERVIPARSWTTMVGWTVGLTLAAVVAWELQARAWGYRPTLNDTPDLWADRREAVQPNSLVIVGDSRPHFDLDLAELEKGLGQRPIQLAIDGSCAFPVLQNLADDESFRGSVIVSLLPTLWFVPMGPPVKNSTDAIARYRHRTVSERAGHHLGMFLEERIAFLKQMDLTLVELLRKVPLPVRAGAGGPPLPPYFNWLDRERQARMWEKAEQPGPLQDRIKYGWIPLFTPPPPPSFVPPEAFGKMVGGLIEKRFQDTAAAVAKLRARGAKVVFVRFPFGGELKALEDRNTPRQGPWARILAETKVPGIYFEDHPELARFQLPEWSHLTAADAVEFTRALNPHLQKAFAQQP